MGATERKISRPAQRRRAHHAIGAPRLVTARSARKDACRTGSCRIWDISWAECRSWIWKKKKPDQDEIAACVR